MAAVLTATLSAPARSSRSTSSTLLDAAADGERDEDLLRAAADHLHGGRAALVGGGDVEEGQLVGALGVVEPGQLDGVTGVAELLEVHALDDAAAVDVEARDDADREAHFFASRAASAMSTISERGWPSSSASGTHGGVVGRAVDLGGAELAAGDRRLEDEPLRPERAVEGPPLRREVVLGQQRARLDVVAGLLEDLADHAVEDGLVEVDPAAGQRPLGVAVPLAVPPGEQHALLVVDHQDVRRQPGVVLEELHAQAPLVRASASSRVNRPS